MESVFSGTLIQKMTKFPHGDNFYGDPDITSKYKFKMLKWTISIFEHCNVSVTCM